MKKIKWLSLLLSAIYVISLFGYWKGVDASVDFQRGIDIIGLFPVYIIGLTLVLLGFFKIGASITSIIGAAILIIGEIAYLLNWSHVFQGIDLTYSMKYMHSGAIVGLVCATTLFFLAVFQQRKSTNKLVEESVEKSL